jgi:hypothetical protein
MLSLARPRCRLRDNIKIYIRERGCENVDWIHLDVDRGQWRDPAITIMNSP